MPGLDYPHIIAVNGEAARLERLPRIRVAQIDAEIAVEVAALDAADQQAPSALRVRLRDDSRSKQT